MLSLLTRGSCAKLSLSVKEELFVLKNELQQRILNRFFSRMHWNVDLNKSLTEVFHANFTSKTWNSVDEQNRQCFVKKKISSFVYVIPLMVADEIIMLSS